MSETRPAVAIVDYGLGNLYSVRNACVKVGLRAVIVSTASEIEAAHGIVLPGIGAFADAIATLRLRDLAEPIKEAAAAGRPVMGVCLGLQLLMSESHEFGVHRGLGLIEGTVEHLGRPAKDDRTLKVPHVGWNQIRPARGWTGTGLHDLSDGASMYFVHSYVVRPADTSVVLSHTAYGDTQFCSSVQVGSVFACQFHPERSAQGGLRIYRNFRTAVERHCGHQFARTSVKEQS